MVWRGSSLGASIALPNAPTGDDGTKAGVGGRSVDAGATGAPNGGVTGVRRLPGVNGGIRPAPASPGDAAGDAGGVTPGATGAGAETTGAGARRRGGGAMAGDGATAAGGRNPARPSARAGELFGKSSAHRTLAPMGISPPQIEQRARRFAPVTLAGSTRKTDWHSGHETFMTRR